MIQHWGTNVCSIQHKRIRNEVSSDSCAYLGAFDIRNSLPCNGNDQTGDTDPISYTQNKSCLAKSRSRRNAISRWGMN